MKFTFAKASLSKDGCLVATRHDLPTPFSSVTVTCGSLIRSLSCHVLKMPGSAKSDWLLYGWHSSMMLDSLATALGYLVCLLLTLSAIYLLLLRNGQR